MRIFQLRCANWHFRCDLLDSHEASSAELLRRRTMAVNQNPGTDQDRSRQSKNKPPANPKSTPQHVRPMDDPGRGHGDKFEEQIPGHSHEKNDKQDQ